MPGRRLGLEEREEIRFGLVRGESLRQIARRIERPVSTVAREVKRSSGPTRYVATCAQRRAERCARRPKTPRLLRDAALARRVTGCLVKDRESPMTIARAEGVSHETIYQAIYRGDRGLDRGLWRYLHHQRRRRRSRRHPGDKRRSVLGQFRPITRRPVAATRRTQIGHLEGDLLIGGNHSGGGVNLASSGGRVGLRSGGGVVRVLMLYQRIRGRPASPRLVRWTTALVLATLASFALVSALLDLLHPAANPFR
ncbi:IS30 family transposase [Aciditerrimonas ferrireducens]|uniref:IS30 family transposase n=1 Tax=Aciditerrimonas ferrireducens TaxID=667306 RepID=UPI00249EBC2F|nr:IS30 family transposase [Aciditerrimonas ferrireducens]